MNTELLSDLENELTGCEPAKLPFEADDETPFPVEALPENMQSVVRELERVYKAPTDLVAPLLLGCASSCLGKGVKLHTHHNDPTYGLLYLLICTYPGINKSTVLKWLQRPMLDLQREARKKQRVDVETALASESTSKKPPTKKEIDSKIEKGVTTLVVEHSSQEGLATSLKHNNEYLAVISSDCSGVVDDLKGTKNNGSFQGELLLKGYGGETYDTNFKVAADEHLEEVRLSVIWAGTDQSLQGFVSDPRVRKRGLLSRFVFAFVDEPIPRRDVERRQVSEQVMEIWQGLITRLLRAFWRSGQPVIVEMDDEAIRLNVELDNHRIDHHHPLRHLSGLPERWAENALRIALVIHCMEYGERAGSYRVDGSTMERAILIMRWFIGREMACMESFDESENIREECKAKVFKFLQDKGPTTLRILKKKFLKNGLDRLADEWVKEGELVMWNASKGDKPSPTLCIPGDDRIPTDKPMITDPL